MATAREQQTPPPKTGTESVPPSETTQIEKQVENQVHAQQPAPPPKPEITPFPDK